VHVTQRRKTNGVVFVESRDEERWKKITGTKYPVVFDGMPAGTGGCAPGLPMSRTATIPCRTVKYSTYDEIDGLIYGRIQTGARSWHIGTSVFMRRTNHVRHSNRW
jgi:hypothetical protein